MPLSLDFIKVYGILFFSRYSYNFSKVFIFSLSKVVQRVVKPLITTYAESGLITLLPVFTSDCSVSILANSSLADSYVA